jgi:hypothetical protein
LFAAAPKLKKSATIGYVPAAVITPELWVTVIRKNTLLASVPLVEYVDSVPLAPSVLIKN